MGTIMGDLVPYLDYEHAKAYLKPDVTKERWEEDLSENSYEHIKKLIVDYIPFAWRKANGCRGISAGRSMDHFKIWFWLIGEDDISEMCDGYYEYYGKAQLIKITEWAGLNPKDFDNGIITNHG